MTKGLFHGLCAFPMTPANAEGHVDTSTLGKIIDRLVEVEVDSIGLLGSTGIYAYLNRDERRGAVRTASEAIGGRVPLMVGIGALRTDAAVLLARDAADEGADGLFMAPVAYTPLTEEEVYRHYATVACATDLPLCIYNNPSTTGFVFTGDLLSRLAALPNIAAVKMPLPGKVSLETELSGLRGKPAGALAIGYSGDWGMADAMLAGADAFYSVSGGILPREVLSMMRAAQAGDDVEVRRIDRAFQPLWTLFREFGSLRIVYVIARQLGLCDVAPPLPVLPLQDGDQRRVRDALAVITDLKVA
ncbi:MAG: dihydrodipicolinate synthase family protein [Janthinobacterium lividum]